MQNNSHAKEGNKCRVKKTSLSQELSKYLAALRPWSFTSSFTPVALGSALAYMEHAEFSLLISLVTCLTALSVHAAGNLVNTYVDYVRGIDTKKKKDANHKTLVDSVLMPGDIAWLGGLSYVLGCCGFLLLAYISPARMEHLALIYFGGLSGSFLYTGGLGLKYVALGDVVVFLTFGPLTVVFAFLSQTGELSNEPIFYAIPLAISAEAVLHCNNTRHMESDTDAGIVTLAILLGHTGSYILFVMLLFLPYIAFVYLGLHYSKWYFLPLLTVFESFKLERYFRYRHLEQLPRKVARLNFIFGLLYVIACILALKH
ncbi:prenyltransferase domain-containing 1-like [Octopus vulgaris]|uniref:Prenyltransferase domain-containing 1-like n=2 Tax=Octopus TaxID=6643 RepID=A0AA36BAH2_OCTVU|nr:ubiA prenyltransferase domain-containing protein 1 homolog [Octopus sinensis]CAI9730831.1 prenyltransferase domain-containing 1-like [Octopus vulgaris]